MRARRGNRGSWTRAAKRCYLIVLGALLLAAGLPTAAADSEDSNRSQTIDVACDINTFVSQGPDIPGVGPDYGASFVVQGVIYPGGTFEENGVDSGLNPDGTPEFPELVIGTWTCRGWFIGDGFATQSGPFVVTTQIYDFDVDSPGSNTVVSEGLELIDLNVPFLRAVTGGTGPNQRIQSGQVSQTAVGANATGLFNFTFEFDTRRPVRFED